MKNFTKNLRENIKNVKTLLPQQDILVFEFETKGKIRCAVIYADGITNKELLGEQVVRPLLVYHGSADVNEIKLYMTSPELKDAKDIPDAVEKILDGDTLLLIDGSEKVIIAGLKTVPVRAVGEPPTDIAVKGPRQGFIEDIKTNTSLIRMRIKTPDLKIINLTAGKQSKTKISIFYIDGIADKKVYETVRKKIESIKIDIVPDSSYIAKIISERPYSIFKQTGSTEKPDIFCAQIAEGRVGIIVDGSPIAFSVPYILLQDFQASEDYFVTPYRATATRIVRYISLFIALYLPAFYVAAELFKIQLIPLNLLLNIASNIQGLPLSPSLEMALVLFTLEVLNEASIRMPKYVGMALSIVGALVLGDTAVSAGFVSTPAIIIIAFSGICLYTVPNLIETTSVLRWIMLFVAGSIGTYGIILFTAYILYYIITYDNYDVPLMAPYSPLVKDDLKDSVVKFKLFSLNKRPEIFKSKNKVRIKNERN